MQNTRKRAWSLFYAGFVAGLAALAFNFFLRIESLAPFPPESAIAAFISVVPASIEEPMVQHFGELAGELGLGVATVIAAAVYGVLFVLFDRYVAPRLKSLPLSSFEVLLSLSLMPWVLFGIVLFPLTGGSLFGSSVASATASSIWTYPLTLLLVQGVFALVLAPRFKAEFRAPSPMAAGPAPVFGKTRREFIEKGTIGFLAVIAGLLGLSNLGSIFSSQIQPSGGSLPIDLQNSPAIFSDPRLKLLVDSEVTPNDSFYRVAIDIIDPAVDVAGWSLAVDGLVNAPKKYGLQDIQALPVSSRYTTLECVSNQINGALISNANWKGVKLSDLFADAGSVKAGAQYVVFYSVDGYSVGIPLERAMLPDSIIAYGMNDQPLPVKHGYPLRGVIPGLYGMMSAKWVNRISILGSDYLGYWQTRGWTNDAEVNTVAFIVIPETGSQVSVSNGGGSILLAGYAFAGDRGISKVELSFDDGKTWQQAQLKKPLSNLTWALWAYEWSPPTKGEAFIYVRATDGNGQPQTSDVSDTFPNGATGYAFVTINVAD
ncbi:MAG: molybdopterin-dependent oxidoreductase [Nitrososphaerales archaeon]|nr:molybdopterin-dependent oxidoreductase [Nitrososphaerales archaeon]